MEKQQHDNDKKVVVSQKQRMATITGIMAAFGIHNISHAARIEAGHKAAPKYTLAHKHSGDREMQRRRNQIIRGKLRFPDSVSAPGDGGFYAGASLKRENGVAE